MCTAKGSGSVETSLRLLPKTIESECGSASYRHQVTFQFQTVISPNQDLTPNHLTSRHLPPPPDRYPGTAPGQILRP